MIDATPKTKFSGHETFFIRKGWLAKGLRAVIEKDDIFVDRANNPMDELGIGSNMVKSLRFWLQAVGLTQEPKSGRRVQYLTELGLLVAEYDMYCEEIATLWALHYRLATNRELATSWYYFFNEFAMKSFSLDDFTRGLESYVQNILGVAPPAASSIAKDFNCILGTYIPRDRIQPGRVSPENNIDCPLGELELIGVDSLKAKTYRKRMPNPSLFPPLVCMFAILSYRDGFRSGNVNSNTNALTLEELLNEPGSPGRVFNLDSLALLEILRRLETFGYIRVIRTAGLDEVRIDTGMTANDCMKLYYEEMR